MEVRKAIDDLRSSLERIAAEDELLGVIAGQITALRQCYPSDRSSFTPGDIGFLQSLGAISDHLRAFIELKEESASVNSLKEYEDIVTRLVRAKRSLAPFSVAKRIAKAIRGLNARLPAIRKQDEEEEKFRLNARILDCEQNPRRCPRRHPMVIRNGTYGHFWGCSRYPFCPATAQLTAAEHHLLTSSQSTGSNRLPYIRGPLEW